MMKALIRWLLTVALLYGVYRETGKWTVLALLLSALGIELVGAQIRAVRADLMALVEAYKKYVTIKKK